MDIGEGDVGVFGDADEGWERVEVPERDEIVAIAGEAVDVVAPEGHVPDGGDVLLGGFAGVGVAGGAGVEGEVEFDAAGGEVRRLVGVGERVESAGADDFGGLEGAIHEAGGVVAEDVDLAGCVGRR